MSEFDLLYLLNELRNSMVALFQWWASVSFALMVVAHLAGTKLTLPLVSGLLVLYSAFTAMVQLLLLERVWDMGHIFTELDTLDSLSGVGQAKLDQNFDPSLVMIFVYWGTFLATTGYLILRYRSERTSSVN